MQKALILFGMVVCFSLATIIQLSAEEARDEKLKEELPENIGRVAYGDDGTQTYFIKNPSNPAKAIFLSMQGSAGCLFSERGPITSEQDVIDNGGPSPRHPSIMIKGISAWTSNDIQVILPNCPDVSHDSSSAEYASAIDKIIQKENKKGLPVFVGGMSRGTIRATNIASRLKGKIAGVILLSATTGNTHDGTTFDPPIDQAVSPFLMIIHKDDSCDSSHDLSNLEEFSSDLKLVKDKNIVKVEGGSGSRSTRRHGRCGARSHHGMNGIHHEIFEIMNKWINERI